jgi:fructose 1,6-bisphosphatase
MEYTTMPQVMEKLSSRFENLNGHKTETLAGYKQQG